MSVTQFYIGFLNSRYSEMCVSIKSLSLPMATPKINPDHIAENPYHIKHGAKHTTGIFALYQ